MSVDRPAGRVPHAWVIAFAVRGVAGRPRVAHPFDFALVVMLGLLGLRIFEATGADIEDVREEHSHRVLRVHGKGCKVVLPLWLPAPNFADSGSDQPLWSGTAGRFGDRTSAQRVAAVCRS